MDELFTRYMYFERAKLGIKSSTTEALRKFYEKDSYTLLNNDYTLENLITLANFWKDVTEQNEDRFSDRVLRKLFVLNFAPNGMWNYFVSVFFMHYKDENEMLNDELFYNFLSKIIAFIWSYAITNPGVNALRTPVFAEMVNIVNDKAVTFNEFKFNTDTVRSMINNFMFYNGRPITKSMLTWWAFNDESQKLLPLSEVFEIEHIYAKNRNEKENTLSNNLYIESLGNKCLLEKRINIRASDYRFADKVIYYQGYVNKRGQEKEGTQIIELLNLSKTNIDFTENDLLLREKNMVESFIQYIIDNDLAN